MPSQKPPERECIYRIDIDEPNGRGTHGWQVRVERKDAKPTKMFSDSKFGSSDAALKAAMKKRDQIFEELGYDSTYAISDKLPSNNTSGILGVHRSETIDQTERIYEFWQTTFPRPEGGQPDARKFNIKFGETDALYKAIECRMEGLSRLIGVARYKTSQEAINRLIDKYLNILIYLESISADEEKTFIKTLLDKSIKNTTKEAIINARVGQASFKDKLVKMKGGKCEVTGAHHLLNSSHIKPWKVCTDSERLDPFNGFLLSPVYDRAFDAGFITFADSGDIMISPEFKEDAKLLGIRSTDCIKNINPFSLVYLKYHRDKKYQIGKPEGQINET